jgi:hypothetical protein
MSFVWRTRRAAICREYDRVLCADDTFVASACWSPFSAMMLRDKPDAASTFDKPRISYGFSIRRASLQIRIALGMALA